MFIVLVKFNTPTNYYLTVFQNYFKTIEIQMATRKRKRT